MLASGKITDAPAAPLCGSSSLGRACSQRRRPLMPTCAYSTLPVAPAGDASSRRPVLSLLSEALAVDAASQKFETLAARSAMVGFGVASFAEAFSPSHGLFGTVDNQALQQYGLALGVAVCVSAALAALNKHRLGGQLGDAVLGTLSGAACGIDRQLDRVLEDVFTGRLVRSLVDVDLEDFI